ncbi:MAG: response regulator [Actinobacteria bacterium]|nr:response regulator [Actinomycetota bacterium]
MPRALVVDDDADIRSVIEVTLDSYECVFAEDGIEALDVLTREEVDVVVLDVMMPRMDGIETLRTIRKDKQLRDLPVVMLTARVAEDDHLRGFSSGADAYLTKPFDPDVLCEVVEAVRRLPDEDRERLRDEEKAKALLLRQIERRFEGAN